MSTATETTLNDEIESFVAKYDNNLPIDEANLAGAVIEAARLTFKACEAQTDDGALPASFSKLAALNGRLTELTETVKRRRESLQQRLRIYTNSETLAINGLKRSIADMETKLSTLTDEHARARLTAALNVSRQELKDRVELRIADRDRKFELERRLNNASFDLQRASDPAQKQALESEIAALKQELARA